MFVFESINENTEVRDNIFNEEVETNAILSSLSEEDSNSLIKSVNGVGFDANGNVLGQDGKVAMTADDLRGNIKAYYESLNAPAEIKIEDYVGSELEVGDVKYTINEKGEAVDAEGNVFKTLDEVKAILAEHATDEPETIEEIVASANLELGLEFKDEEGNDITFDLNTVEGMAARDKYIVDNLAATIAQTALDDIFHKDADFESLYLWKKANGGSSAGWSPAVDYGQVTLLDSAADGAEDQYRDLIIKNEVAQGRDADAAKQFASYLIEDGKGEEFAKKALTNLNATKDAKLEQDRIANQARIDADAKAINEYWGGIENSINSGKVGGITIPAFIPIKQEDGTIKNVPRKVLYDYMSNPVQDGLSQNQLRLKSMTVEDQIIDAYMGLTGNNHKSVVDAKTADNKIKLIRKVKDVNKGSGNRSFGGGKAANDTVVL